MECSYDHLTSKAVHLGNRDVMHFRRVAGLSVKLKTVIDSLCLPLYAGDWNVLVWRRAEKV